MKSKAELVARIICKYHGYDPDKLEPGSLPKIDGTCPNGDPGHFMWRQYVTLANKIIKVLKS